MKAPPEISQELPEVFLKRMADLLGDEFIAFRACLHQSPSTGIRVNTLKISPQIFTDLISYKLSPVPWCSDGFTVDELPVEAGIIPPGRHPYHSAGLYYLQEPSAMAAGEILSPQPGEKILDLAAAPGGKSTHLAALMENTGLLVANEIHPKRVWDLAENLERCGVTNAIITNESPQRLAEHFGDFFDRVLLDAPCSGEGMFRKSERARKDWKPGSANSCAIRQSAILEQAAQLVKPGGSLVYTTCTFSPEENEGVIVGFLDKHPEFDIKTIRQVSGLVPSKPEWIGLPQSHKINRAMRIWPHQTSGEGHFIAYLRKNERHDNKSQPLGKKPETSSRGSHKPKDASPTRAILNEFTRTNLSFSFENQQIHSFGSYVYCIPGGTPALSGLKVIHPGWWLGTIQKERFLPSHALAMGIRAGQARNILSLQTGDRQLSAYLGGESFTSPGENAWVLVTVDGYPIGWGKRVQNVIKNYYPHGLRRQG